MKYESGMELKDIYVWVWGIFRTWRSLHPPSPAASSPPTAVMLWMLCEIDTADQVFVCVCACLPAVVAVEVIRVVGVILEQQRLLLNNGVTLLTDVLAEATSFLSVVAWTTQVPEESVRNKWEKEEEERRILIRSHAPQGSFCLHSHIMKHYLSCVIQVLQR